VGATVNFMWQPMKASKATLSQLAEIAQVILRENLTDTGWYRRRLLAEAEGRAILAHR
jgi:hypothetical protein